MSNRRLTLLLTPIALGLANLVAAPATARTPEIACKLSARVPTIMATLSVQEQTQSVPLLSFLPEYFSPEEAVRHCWQTAETLQSLYQNDEVQYLVSDHLNNQSAICAVERRGVGCDSYSAHVLITFDPEINPNLALYDMLGSKLKQTQPAATRTSSRLYTSINQSALASLWQLLF
ncbi:MAG: COP23 domain-containing protein [Cyanophyceae cyanobacterium]